MNFRLVKYTSFLVTLISQLAVAQGSHPSFSVNDPFEIELHADFKSFVENAKKDKYIPAVIKYKLDGKELERSVRIKPRGQLRRKMCEIPPIRIHFNDEHYQIPLFDKLNKVKLVNECGFEKKYQDYLVKEYLTYKIYERISEYSFQTWLLRVKFIDTNDSTNNFISYSFIIEDIDELASRFNSEEIEIEGLAHSNLNTDQESIIMLFQYMIGNTDLFVENLHNLKLIRSLSDTIAKPIPIPYDFDFSGLVNSDYANTGDLPIKNVKTRYYIGDCRPKDYYPVLFAKFTDKKQEIYSIINSCDLLDTTNKEEMISFLDEFFEILENPKKAKRKIIRHCWKK